MLINYSEATRILQESCATPLDQSIPLRESLNCVLSETIYAPSDHPRFDNSAMDGIACRLSDLKPCEGLLSVKATIYAGTGFAESSPGDFKEIGSCVRIMTGAPVPQEYDTIIPVEWLKDNHATSVRVDPQAKPNEGFVRKRGEDFVRGEALLQKNSLLTPEHAMLLAQAGVDSVRTYKKPKVLILTTGDEIKSVGTQLADGEHYNSAEIFLEMKLRLEGVCANPVRVHLADDLEKALRIIGPMLENCDLVLSTGAVSKGQKDFIPELVQQLGYVKNFHGVGIKPGKPVLFAQKGQKFWLGLPGNPVSTAVGWEFFVRPFLHFYANYPFPERQSLVILKDINKPLGLECFYRASIVDSNSVHVLPKQGSAQLFSYIESNAYVMLSANANFVNAGTLVNVQKF